MLGAEIISKEEHDKTAEFLMVKPVSRTKIITSKIFAAATIIFVFNIATSVSSCVMLSYYANGTPFAGGLAKLMVSLLAIQIVFIAVGTFCAAAISQPKLSSAVATGILLAMFMVSVVVDLSEKMSSLRYITIFKYFDAKDILKGGYEVAYPVLSVVLLIVCIYSTYHFYKKRDLKI
jgi:ABC-2 type transport system permease protein